MRRECSEADAPPLIQYKYQILCILVPWNILWKLAQPQIVWPALNKSSNISCDKSILYSLHLKHIFRHTIPHSLVYRCSSWPWRTVYAYTHSLWPTTSFCVSLSSLDFNSCKHCTDSWQTSLRAIYSRAVQEGKNASVWILNDVLSIFMAIT